MFNKDAFYNQMSFTTTFPAAGWRAFTFFTASSSYSSGSDLKWNVQETQSEVFFKRYIFFRINLSGKQTEG